MCVTHIGIPEFSRQLHALPRMLADMLQEALMKAGFDLNPHHGRFKAVLSIVRAAPGMWRAGFSSADLAWRLEPHQMAAHAGGSCSAVNKLDEALRTIEAWSHCPDFDVRTLAMMIASIAVSARF